MKRQATIDSVRYQLVPGSTQEGQAACCMYDMPDRTTRYEDMATKDYQHKKGTYISSSGGFSSISSPLYFILIP